MQDLLPSLIRTYVPLVAGALVVWLAEQGVILEQQAADGLTVFLAGIVSAVYYLVVRLLETKYPSFGWLLGSVKKPEYK